MKDFLIRLPKELHKWLKLLSVEKEVSMAEIIRELLEAKRNEGNKI